MVITGLTHFISISLICFVIQARWGDDLAIFEVSGQLTSEKRVSGGRRVVEVRWPARVWGLVLWREAPACP